MKKFLIAVALTVALALGVGLHQAKRADAAGYCSPWQWLTQTAWCQYWTTCGPRFWVNYGGQWYLMDYCGNRWA